MISFKAGEENQNLLVSGTASSPLGSFLGARNMLSICTKRNLGERKERRAQYPDSAGSLFH